MSVNKTSHTSQGSTWELAPLANSDNDPRLKTARQEAAKAISNFCQKWQHQSAVYVTDSAVLRQALDDYEALMRNYGVNSQEWYYFNLRSAQDQLDTTLKGLANSSDQATLELGNQIQFFTLSLSKIPKADQTKHLTYPGLEPYHHYLERLFAEGQHTLSEAEEKILNLTSLSSHDLWVRMTSTLLAAEKVEVLDHHNQTKMATLPELLSLTNSQNKQVRDMAAGHVHQITAKHLAVATEEINAILQHKHMVDRLRGFDRPDQARHLADDIDSDVVDALMSAVEQSYAIAHRYYQLKARLLHQKELAYHERNVEYGQLNQSYPFAQAKQVITQVFKQLDPQFSQIFSQFVKQGQLDVYPRQGKVGGAFCAHASIIQPTYVLLNHTDRMQDVLTLAHEMGHAINNELMRQKQHALTFDTPLATAEVASTFMEDFVLEHIAKASDPQTQLAINMMKLNDDVSSIFRQVAAYRFEQQLHAEYQQHSYLSQEQIGQIFQHHMASYMGPAVAQSSGSQNWWVYWSHFRSFFYVYSYASGLLISKSLQTMVRKNPGSIQSVKGFLAAGTSASPKTVFARLGIHISQPDFWQLGLSSIESLLQQTERLAEQQAD